MVPIIKQRNEVLLEARLSTRNDSTLKQKYINIKNNIRDAIKAAKSKWLDYLSSRIGNMHSIPKDIWKAISIMKLGFILYHVEYNLMKFCKYDGNLTINNSENLHILWDYFYGVYNRKTEVDWEYLNSIKY